MSKALVIVDYQNDFLPNGALGVSDGHKAYVEIARQIDDPSVKVIVFTRDWHPKGHISFDDYPRYENKSWPEHCVQGTEGAEIDNLTWQAAIASGKPVLVVDKGYDKNKEAYSGFEGTVSKTVNISDDRAEDLRLIGAPLDSALTRLQIGRLVVTGLALDYCVKATAIDGGAAGYAVTVPIEGTRPVDYASGVQAVVDMATTFVAFT